MKFRAAGYDWEWNKKKTTGTLVGIRNNKLPRTSVSVKFPIVLTKVSASIGGSEVAPKWGGQLVTLRSELLGDINFDVSWKAVDVVPEVEEFVP